MRRIIRRRGGWELSRIKKIGGKVDKLENSVVGNFVDGGGKILVAPRE